MSHAGPNLVSYPPSGPDRRVVIHLEGPVDELAALVRELLAGRMNPVVPPPGTEAAVVVSAPSLPWGQAVAAWKDWATARGMKPSTLKAYARMVERVRIANGWIKVSDATGQHVSAFIAARIRNDHDGKPWGQNTCYQCIHAVKSFGEWMSSMDLPDPFAKLQPPGQTQGPQKQSLTVDGARRFLAVSMARAHADGRANPHTPLFWAFMLYTGLRHEESSNVLWGDVDLDGATPGITVRADLIGNKATRRDWVPLHPRMVSILRDHRATISNRPTDRVFYRPPKDSAFEVDRVAAKLPKRTPQGSVLSPHSLRVTFATWLDQTGCPNGLREKLVRHRSGLTSDRYTTATEEEKWAAVARLPDVWPCNDGGDPVTPPNPHGVPPTPPIFGPNGEDVVKALASVEPMRYSVGANRRPPNISQAHAAEQDPQGDSHSQLIRQPRDPQLGGVPESGSSPVLAVTTPEIEVVRVLTAWLDARIRAPR